MKRIFALFLLIVFYACGDKKAENGKELSQIEGVIMSKMLSTKDAREAMLKEAESLVVPTTSMTFNEITHDFGTVIAETESFTEFKVTNTGNSPLIISNVKASCGCTTPEKPVNPIQPGQSDVIKVGFKPTANQLGVQSKTVTVKANTEPELMVLTIKALVESSSNNENINSEAPTE